MIYLFIISCVLIGILILVMFLILKNAVTKISDQTKAYFVDKLQAYDYLINEKEEKLNEINKQIEEKELGIEEDNKDSENKNFEFDYNIIDLFNATKYQDSSLFELNKFIEVLRKDHRFLQGQEIMFLLKLMKMFLSICFGKE